MNNKTQRQNKRPIWVFFEFFLDKNKKMYIIKCVIKIFFIFEAIMFKKPIIFFSVIILLTFFTHNVCTSDNILKKKNPKKKIHKDVFKDNNRKFKPKDEFAPNPWETTLNKSLFFVGIVTAGYLYYRIINSA
jgi:hypothetical protein